MPNSLLQQFIYVHLSLKKKNLIFHLNWTRVQIEHTTTQRTNLVRLNFQVPPLFSIIRIFSIILEVTTQRIYVLRFSIRSGFYITYLPYYVIASYIVTMYTVCLNSYVNCTRKGVIPRRVFRPIFDICLLRTNVYIYIYISVI